MKVLICLQCQHFVALKRQWRACACGETGGRYLEDRLHAEYYGEHVVPLGLANPSLTQAILNATVDEREKVEREFGHGVTAWIIPWNSPRLKKIVKPEITEIGENDDNGSANLHPADEAG